MELVCQQQNNENIPQNLDFFIKCFFFLTVKICFILIFKRKNELVLVFNIAHFRNFEMSVSF